MGSRPTIPLKKQFHCPSSHPILSHILFSESASPIWLPFSSIKTAFHLGGASLRCASALATRSECGIEKSAVALHCLGEKAGGAALSLWPIFLAFVGKESLQSCSIGLSQTSSRLPIYPLIYEETLAENSTMSPCCRLRASNCLPQVNQIWSQTIFSPNRTSLNRIVGTSPAYPFLIPKRTNSAVNVWRSLSPKSLNCFLMKELLPYIARETHMRNVSPLGILSL